jgi:hypothetical protein
VRFGDAAGFDRSLRVRAQFQVGVSGRSARGRVTAGEPEVTVRKRGRASDVDARPLICVMCPCRGHGTRYGLESKRNTIGR